MHQHLNFALCDGVFHRCETERGARQRRHTFVDEKEWVGINVRFRCTAVDPKTGKPDNLIFTFRGNGLQ